MEKLRSYKSAGLILLVLILSAILSAFLGGILAVLGGNVELVGLSSITFDPVLTIAYIILYHYLAHFHQVPGKAAYWLFLFAIFLSFTVNFIQGAILMILFFVGLKRFKLLENGQPQRMPGQPQ